MYEFLDLNNRGIQLLDEGEYEEAAELFRQSFNTMKRMIESNRSDAQEKSVGPSMNGARDPSRTGSKTPPATDEAGSTECTGSKLESVGSNVSSLEHEETTSRSSGSSNTRRRRRTARSTYRLRRTTSLDSTYARTSSTNSTPASGSSLVDESSPRSYSDGTATPLQVNETTTSATYSNRTRSKRKQQHDEFDKAKNNDGGSKSLSIGKRQKINAAGDFVSVASLFTDVSPSSNTERHIGPLGRPLWLQPPKRRGGNTLSILASSILYNFAYALHRMGTKASSASPTSKKRHYLQQALNIYGVAMRVSVKGRSPVVLWLCCHNVQHLLVQRYSGTSRADATRYIQKYQKLETHKANILRSLSGGRPNGPWTNQTCLMVLAMLGLGGSENPDSPAAAA